MSEAFKSNIFVDRHMCLQTSEYNLYAMVLPILLHVWQANRELYAEVENMRIIEVALFVNLRNEVNMTGRIGVKKIANCIRV
jgi:hypothetical protein